MRAVLFDTEQDAKNFSQACAIEKGCSGVTVYWYATKPLNNGKFSAIIHDNGDLETVEITQEDFLQAGGEEL